MSNEGEMMKMTRSVALIAFVVLAVVVALVSLAQEKSARAKSSDTIAAPSRPANPNPITITNCHPSTAAATHAPKKSQSGVVTFTATDGDYTIIFEKPDVFGMQSVPIVQNTDVGVHVSAEPGTGAQVNTHFCFQSRSLCSKACPPANGDWSNWLKKGPRGDPNDIIVP